MRGLGSRVWGAGFGRVQGLWFRVQGIGYRVEGIEINLIRESAGPPELLHPGALHTQLCSRRHHVEAALHVAHAQLLRLQEGRVQGSGFRVQGAGCRVQGAGFRVQGAGFRVQGSGFMVQGAGFRVQGAGCRVQGTGFRVQGSGFRV